nr:MAG: hypothetical protein 1 [Henan cysto-like virus]
MHYLVPDTGDFAALQTIASRAQVPMLNPRNIRDYVLMTEGLPIAVVVIPEDVMLIATRHAASVFPTELPVVLHAVPGLIYPPGWASMAATFPPVHFRDFEATTKNSGLMATRPEDLEARGRGAAVNTTRDYFEELRNRGASTLVDRTTADDDADTGLDS